MTTKAEKRKLIEYISLLSRSSLNLRKQMLKDMPEKYVKTVCEVLHNMLHGVVPVKATNKRQLAKYKHALRCLGNPPFRGKKRFLINQKGSGLFTAILPILASILLGSNV
jgi:hypothetical protein